MAYTTFKLPSGATLSVESKRTAVQAQAGVVEASGVSDKLGGAWSDGMALVAEIAGEAVQQLRKATESAKEVSVEFGVSISGKTGIILVEGTTEANLKVVIKW